jgi:hypothetical protein
MLASALAIELRHEKYNNLTCDIVLDPEAFFVVAYFIRVAVIFKLKGRAFGFSAK